MGKWVPWRLSNLTKLIQLDENLVLHPGLSPNPLALQHTREPLVTTGQLLCSHFEFWTFLHSATLKSSTRVRAQIKKWRGWGNPCGPWTPLWILPAPLGVGGLSVSLQFLREWRLASTPPGFFVLLVLPLRLLKLSPWNRFLVST